jgi:hypothetical protein
MVNIVGIRPYSTGLSTVKHPGGTQISCNLMTPGERGTQSYHREERRRLPHGPAYIDVMQDMAVRYASDLRVLVTTGGIRFVHGGEVDIGEHSHRLYVH